MSPEASQNLYVRAQDHLLLPSSKLVITSNLSLLSHFFEYDTTRNGLTLPQIAFEISQNPFLDMTSMERNFICHRVNHLPTGFVFTVTTLEDLLQHAFTLMIMLSLLRTEESNSWEVDQALFYSSFSHSVVPISTCLQEMDLLCPYLRPSEINSILYTFEGSMVAHSTFYSSASVSTIGLSSHMNASLSYLATMTGIELQELTRKHASPVEKIIVLQDTKDIIECKLNTDISTLKSLGPSQLYDWLIYQLKNLNMLSQEGLILAERLHPLLSKLNGDNSNKENIARWIVHHLAALRMARYYWIRRPFIKLMAGELGSSLLSISSPLETMARNVLAMVVIEHDEEGNVHAVLPYCRDNDDKTGETVHLATDRMQL